MEALKEPAQGRALPPARRVVLRPLEGRTPSPGVPACPASWGSSSLIIEASLSPGKLGSSPSSVLLHLQTPSQAEPTGGRGSVLRPSCCPVPSVSAGSSWCACVCACLCVCVCELGGVDSHLVEGGPGRGRTLALSLPGPGPRPPG